MKELKQHNILYGRTAYSLLIAAAYLLGRCIPIPWTISETGQDASGGIQEVIRSAVGSGASGLNVFSLGLMPWIAATILVYFLYSASGRSRRMAVSGRNRLTILLTLLISLFQAILETADVQLTSAYGLGEGILSILTVMVLTTGSLVLVWLIRRNEAWGIGGQKLLICMNLLDTLLGVLAGWIGEQLPLQSGKTFALETALLIFGILGGAIAGPAYGAMYDAALMSYRGYSGRWWQRYVKVLKREWKGCILPGVAMGLLVAMIINILNSIMISGTVPNMMIISILVFLIAFMCIFTWFWPQKLMLDLDLKQLLKNSWLMTLMHPMKTFGAVALRLVYYVAMLVLYPYSLIFLIVLGDWFPSFMSVRIIYKTMDYRMNLDYRYEEALEEETADEEGDANEDPVEPIMKEAGS